MTSKSFVQSTVNALGYELMKRPQAVPTVPSSPPASDEDRRRSAESFCNEFDIDASCGHSREDIERRIGEYFWHYPFRFGDIAIEADHATGKGLRGRHYQRYMHVFPAVLSAAGGSLEGRSVLDIACNAGFWSIQARRHGAARVLGVEASEKNVEQARFVAELIGLDGVDYRVMNAYDVTTESAGTFDVTFQFGLLYHLDEPIAALRRLREVTSGFAVVDTTLTPTDMPVVRLLADEIHDQNWSNELAFLPSASAVVLMLRHAGFATVERVPPHGTDLPPDYLNGRRATFIART